ncbi:hypothetical protein VP01_97g2 [Puccinia sorghi]|uniref:Oxidoreductase-like domain-containing protein n=1 Tax=Puccinia sorghi TaxID=27349 RepID=A0A0L6U7V7_9BASI|nr:hypothetical protein VP01_97g2 [Puccinia sorghi]
MRAASTSNRSAAVLCHLSGSSAALVVQARRCILEYVALCLSFLLAFAKNVLCEPGQTPGAGPPPPGRIAHSMENLNEWVYCRRIPGHCARSVHSSTRLTYVLVPDPSPAGAEKSHRNSSNLGTPLPSSWYPIDCSRLNLSNQFATNPVAHLSPISLSQEDQSRGSDGSCQSGVVKITSPNIVAPPKPPGPEDCCMSGCATCVYDIYAQESEEYLESLKQRDHLNEHYQGASKAELTEEIDDQVILNNSLKVFAQFEKNRHR